MTLRLRILLDLAAVGLFIAALAYWWLDNLTHELIGSVFLGLLVAHNVFNRRWWGRVGQGPMDVARRVNLAVIVALAVAMLVLLVTSVLISRDLVPGLALGSPFAARSVHLFAAYWALALLGLHLGTRWPMVMSVARQAAGLSGPHPLRTWALRGLAALVAVLGVLASLEMGLGPRLALRQVLDMWDFTTDTPRFFANYLAIVGMFAVLGHYGMAQLSGRGFFSR